jgi:hypothetical protein
MRVRIGSITGVSDDPTLGTGPQASRELSLIEAGRRLAADEQLRRRVAEAARVAANEIGRSRLRFAWLVASPAVLGAALIIFVALGWGASGLIESSGTTSTALIVGALLVLVPAVLAALQRTTATQHAEQMFEHAESVLSPPAPPNGTQLPDQSPTTEPSVDGRSGSAQGGFSSRADPIEAAQQPPAGGPARPRAGLARRIRRSGSRPSPPRATAPAD